MEKVVASAPARLPNAAVLLRDQFVENVNDSALRRELKQLVHGNTELSPLDVCAEAIRWECEGRPNSSSERYPVPSLCAAQNSRVLSQVDGPSTSSTTSQLVELAAMLHKQQEQIDQLSKILLKRQAAPSPRTKRGNVICRWCQQSGHYASDCDNERVPAQLSNLVYAPQVAATTISQQALN